MDSKRDAEGRVAKGLSGSTAEELNWRSLKTGLFSSIGVWAIAQAECLASKQLLSVSASSLPVQSASVAGEDSDSESAEFLVAGADGRHRREKRKRMDLDEHRT